MASKKKRKEAEDGSDESRSGELSDEEVNVDFEAFPLCDGDSGGITALLNQLFGKSDVSQVALTDLLIVQQPVGCVFKPSESPEGIDDDDVVYGLVSVTDLHQEATVQLVKFLKEKCKKHCSPEIRETMMRLIENSGKRRTGFIFNERFQNIPHHIALPAFTSLRSDMKEAGGKYQFSDFLLIMKLHKSASGVSKKKKKEAKKRNEEEEVLFVNAEEELLFEECEASFDYPVSDDSESTIEVEEGVLRPFRRVVCFSDVALEKFVKRLEKELK